MMTVIMQLFSQMPWLAVLVAFLVSFFGSMLWYSLFSKQWMAYTGMTSDSTKKMNMARCIILEVVNTLICVFGVGISVAFMTGGPTAPMLGDVLLASGILWLGVALPNSASMDIWEGRPLGLFLINNIRYLLQILLIALIFFYL